jgi:hypothetical protein
MEEEELRATSLDCKLVFWEQRICGKKSFSFQDSVPQGNQVVIGWCKKRAMCLVSRHRSWNPQLWEPSWCAGLSRIGHTGFFVVVSLPRGPTLEFFLLSFWEQSLHLHHEPSRQELTLPHGVLPSRDCIQVSQRHCRRGSKTMDQRMFISGYLRANPTSFRIGLLWLFVLWPINYLFIILHLKQAWSYTNSYVEHVCKTGTALWNLGKEEKEKRMIEHQ